MQIWWKMSSAYCVFVKDLSNHEYKKYKDYIAPRSSQLKYDLEKKRAELRSILQNQPSPMSTKTGLAFKLDRDEKIIPTSAKPISIWRHNNQVIIPCAEQVNAVKLSLPGLVLGHAGTGKTTICQEAIKEAAQADYENASENNKLILYVTASEHLVAEMKPTFSRYRNVLCLTYKELFTIVEGNKHAAVQGKEEFSIWINTKVTNQNNRKKNLKKTDKDKDNQFLKHPEKIWLEMRIASGWTAQEYKDLGKRQTSCVNETEKNWIWKTYREYLAYLKTNNFISYDFTPMTAIERYTKIFVDEAPDFSGAQLRNLMQLAIGKGQGLNPQICYFANSYQNLTDKISRTDFILSMLGKEMGGRPVQTIQLSYAFRCAPRILNVVRLFRDLGHILRGGAFDNNEKTEIIPAPGLVGGEILWIEPDRISEDETKRLIGLTNSTQVAVVTLEGFEQEAKDYFAEIFKEISEQEEKKIKFDIVLNPATIKGLSYHTIIWYKGLEHFKEASKKLTGLFPQGKISGQNVPNFRPGEGEEDIEHSTVCNEALVAVSRATDCLIICAPKPNNLKIITDYLQEEIAIFAKKNPLPNGKQQ